MMVDGISLLGMSLTDAQAALTEAYKSNKVSILNCSAKYTAEC